MGKYRKLPVVIEAFKFYVDAIPDWFTDNVIEDEIRLYNCDYTGSYLPEKPHCMIQTLEGVMRGEVGDYIIQGVNGEIYPCKAEIFEKTYERVLTEMQDCDLQLAKLGQACLDREGKQWD